MVDKRIKKKTKRKKIELEKVAEEVGLQDKSNYYKIFEEENDVKKERRIYCRNN